MLREMVTCAVAGAVGCVVGLLILFVVVEPRVQPRKPIRLVQRAEVALFATGPPIAAVVSAGAGALLRFQRHRRARSAIAQPIL
jgi:hypothetical protein